MRFILLLSLACMVGCSSYSKKDQRKMLAHSVESLKRGPASADEAKPFSDHIVLMALECKMIVIDMVGGKLTDGKGDPGSVFCDVKNFKVKCNFFDSDMAMITTREMVGGVHGQEGAISTPGNSDVFIMNMVTRRFYSTANIYFDHGRVRGQKLCSGEFLYEKELKATKAK